MVVKYSERITYYENFAFGAHLKLFIFQYKNHFGRHFTYYIYQYVYEYIKKNIFHSFEIGTTKQKLLDKVQ